jgi:hypothetical protein
MSPGCEQPTRGNRVEGVAGDLTETSTSSGVGVLGNMSARPRTSIERTVPATRRDWVAFGPVTRRVRLDRALFERLDTAWEALGFTGAFMLHLSSTVEREGLRVTTCRDEILTLNVLLRTRGTLLLAKTPAVEETYELEGLTLLTDDPRLLEVAR